MVSNRKNLMKSKHNCLKFICSVSLDMSGKNKLSKIQTLKSWQTANSCNQETNQLILPKLCSGNMQRIPWYKRKWGAGIWSVKIKIPPFLWEELCVYPYYWVGNSYLWRLIAWIETWISSYYYQRYKLHECKYKLHANNIIQFVLSQ